MSSNFYERQLFLLIAVITTAIMVVIYAWFLVPLSPPSYVAITILIIAVEYLVCVWVVTWHRRLLAPGSFDREWQITTARKSTVVERLSAYPLLLGTLSAAFMSLSAILWFVLGPDMKSWLSNPGSLPTWSDAAVIVGGLVTLVLGVSFASLYSISNVSNR